MTFTALPPTQGTGAYTTAEKDAWMARLGDWVRGGGNLVLTDGALRALPELVDVQRLHVGQTTVYTGQLTFRRCVDYAADDTDTCTRDVRTLDDPLARDVNQPGSRFNYDHPLGLEPYALTYTGYILACNLLDARCPVVAADAQAPTTPAAAGSLGAPAPAPLAARSPAAMSARAVLGSATSGATGRARRASLVHALRADRSFGARGLVVRFTLTRAAAVRIELVRGGRVARRVSAGRRTAGTHALRVDGRGLRRGLYRLRVIAVAGARRDVTALTVRRA